MAIGYRAAARARAVGHAIKAKKAGRVALVRAAQAKKAAKVAKFHKVGARTKLY